MKLFKRQSALVIFAIMVVASSPTLADTESLDGEALFNQRTCFTCHGKDGKTPILPSYPLIAGQNVQYVLQQLRDIKSGARANGGSPAMAGVMHLVNDEEMQLLAEFISNLER